MTQEPPRLNVGEPEESQPERADGQEPSEETVHLSVSAEEGGQQSGRDRGDENARDALDDRTPHEPPAPLQGAAADSPEEATSIGEVENSIHDASPAAPTQAAEPADDSLDSILLEAGAKPLQQRDNPSVGSRTLMGVGIEGFDLASFRGGTKRAADDPIADALDSDQSDQSDQNDKTEIRDQGRPLDAVAAELRAASADEGPELEVDLDDAAGGDAAAGSHEENTPALIESKLTSQPPSDEPQTISLLDEVAQALNVQAAEYRDRARGRLPGMPATPSAGPAGALASGSSDAEFEDPEDGHPALTPGVISVEEDDGALVLQSPAAAKENSPQEVTEKVHSGEVLAPPPGLGAALKGAPGRVDGSSGADIRSADRGEPRSGDKAEGRVDSRPTVKMPPVPGISLGATSPSVGPPPGVSRPTTPVSGLSLSTSGRIRLPTPGPGLSGRITLPPGTTAPLSSPRGRGDLSDTMPATPISIEASRRNTAGVPIGRGSGRVSTRGNMRVTEPVIHDGAPSSFAALLTAHVKLATVNLAGLIALTFAGGLFVGMLVWRGQGRGEQPAAFRSLTTATEASTAETKTQPKSTAGGESNVAPEAAVGATALVPGAAAGAAAAAAMAVTHGEPGHPAAHEAIVAPLPASGTSAGEGVNSPGSPGHKPPAATAARTAVRPRRPAAPSGGTTAATANETASASAASKPPALKTAALTASKPMANNAGAKTGAKPKAKAAWKDPFAD